jgi:predicted nucleic acid-binding protein
MGHEFLIDTNAPADELQKLDNFIQEAHIFNLDEPVVLKSIKLRQEYRLKVPDAVIAATALLNNSILISAICLTLEKFKD